jgi:hypothetical protein
MPGCVKNLAGRLAVAVKVNQNCIKALLGKARFDTPTCAANLNADLEISKDCAQELYGVFVRTP